MSPVRFWEKPPPSEEGVMQSFLTVVQVVSSLFLIIVVIVQGGNQGGVSAAFGGGNSQGVFGASGATTLLGKLTYVFAFFFMASSIGLSLHHDKSSKVGLKERLEQQQKDVKPADGTTAAPAPVAAPSVEPQKEATPQTAPISETPEAPAPAAQ